MNDSKPTVNVTSSKSMQFRLSTIFIVTSIATILAAYLSPRGDDLLLAGLVTTIVSAFFGFVVGYFNKPLSNRDFWAERVFWAVVAAAMMQAVCATAYMIDRSGIVAWPLASGFAAAIVAKPIGRYRRMTYGALTAGSVIGVYSLLASDVLTVWIANTASAAIGGALLAMLVEVVQSLQGSRRIWQPIIGLAFVSAAIGFSILAPRMIPGW